MSKNLTFARIHLPLNDWPFKESSMDLTKLENRIIKPLENWLKDHNEHSHAC